MAHPPDGQSHGDGYELGVSFQCCDTDTMRQYTQVTFTERAISCYHTGCKLSLLSNHVTTKLEFHSNEISKINCQ